MNTNKAVDRVLLAVMLALLLLATVPLFGQDSAAKLDARWREAGTTPYTADRLGLDAQMPAPHPGYYHCGTAGWFRYCPCSNTPYAQWTDPETGNVGYWRYDYTPVLYTGNSACGLVPAPCIDGQGGPNHSQQGIGAQPMNYLIPLEPQPDVNNYYPVPETGTGLGAIWAQFNTPPPTFPGLNYSQKMKSNPVFVTAWNIKRPIVDADPGCQGGAITPTPSRTFTPTPVPTARPTPTPAPSQFGRYITWASDKGIMAGCGGGNFCPGTPVNGLLTRAQFCAVQFNTYKLDHPSEPLPACKPLYADVICGGN